MFYICCVVCVVCLGVLWFAFVAVCQHVFLVLGDVCYVALMFYGVLWKCFTVFVSMLLVFCRNGLIVL